MKPSNELSRNKKAFYNYEILDGYEAGLVLVGTEVKSAKENGIQLAEAYVVIKGAEAYLKSALIPHYSHGNQQNHEERRDRKLLLHKYEIEKLKRTIQLKGYTILPLSAYLKNGVIKLKIAVGVGKKQRDKRETIKKREITRDLQRRMKQ